MAARSELGRLTRHWAPAVLVLAGAAGCGSQGLADHARRPAGRPEAGACASSSPVTTGVMPTPAVRFVSTRRGYVSGPSGIFMTTDGGSTWRHSYAGAAGHIDFVGHDTGWALTPGGLVSTVDGGACWKAAPRPPAPLSAVDFVDSSVGWAITSPGGSRPPALLDTVDGGARWHAADTPAVPESVCFSNRVEGYVGAGGSVYSTRDGARTWSRVLMAPSIGSPQTAHVYCAGRHGAWALFTGRAVAAGNVAYIVYRSPDGVRWTPVLEQTQFRYPPAPEGPGAYPGPLSVIDPGTAAFIGNNPAVGTGEAVPVIVADGGDELAQGHPVPSLTGAVSASFPTRSRGWVVGPVPTGGWAVYVTVDGGGSWVPQLRINART